jgi:hypothetical protein
MTTKATAVAAPERDEFDGMSLTACCTGCNVGRCTITNEPYCGHPAKGSLHPSSLRDPVVIERHARAKLAVEHMRLDWSRSVQKG